MEKCQGGSSNLVSFDPFSKWLPPTSLNTKLAFYLSVETTDSLRSINLPIPLNSQLPASRLPPPKQQRQPPPRRTTVEKPTSCIISSNPLLLLLLLILLLLSHSQHYRKSVSHLLIPPILLLFLPISIRTANPPIAIPTATADRRESTRRSRPSR
jgi:hypothetical protein